ncbi:uncharacterized protein BDZ99DRAFT_567270 [Mytilinidion resinicola]|uniref:Uncharacterized protein n=1 Tax=Mytilinidion resinicola TaxID=574789 RepID=A0A6A6Z3W6_9PEZI|nr:uncharacterized protein BDZ99DRAFT_567270 [Mytilinidion resinicola]KAF2815429.1 hypothetical protein BDZ99DRAFT_567270 [Mytilinidion resinicola]
MARERVPGDNPAYYTGPKKANQLFDISNFQMAPNPPTRNKRVFFWLESYIPALPGLENATLLTKMKAPDRPDIIETEAKISNFKAVVVRRDLVYGGPLKEDGNEMLADFWLWGPAIHTGNHMCEAVAKLPNDCQDALSVLILRIVIVLRIAIVF